METARCKAFLAAAEEGSFIAAADKLGYTPSGVSQLVRALEDDLGLELLERSRRGVTLTDSGERLLPEVRFFLGHEAQLYETASDIKGLVKGAVSIASFSSIAARWLPEIIVSFQEQYPGVELEILEGVGMDIRRWMREGRVDMAFFSRVEAEDLPWTDVAETYMTVMLPKDHPLAKKKKFPVERLAEENLILPSLGQDRDIDKMLRTHGLTVEYKYRSLEPNFAIAMVEKGLGVSMDNALFTSAYKDRLVVLPVEPRYPMYFGIATSPTRSSSPAAKRFLEHAISIIKDMPVE